MDRQVLHNIGLLEFTLGMVLIGICYILYTGYSNWNSKHYTTTGIIFSMRYNGDVPGMETYHKVNIRHRMEMHSHAVWLIFKSRAFIDNRLDKPKASVVCELLPDDTLVSSIGEDDIYSLLFEDWLKSNYYLSNIVSVDSNSITDISICSNVYRLGV